MNVLELDDVQVAYAERVLWSGLSLVVQRGQRVAVLGPNGAGKSTLLKVIVGVHPVRAGRVRVLGQLPPSRQVGFVPQEVGASVLPWLSTRDNIVLPLRLHGWSQRDTERALAEVVAVFDPLHSLDLHAPKHTLSQGQLQLSALLRALVSRPALLVCDEPFSALDAVVKAQVQAGLNHLHELPDAPALVLVTHDPADVALLTERSVMLSTTCPDLTQDSVERSDLRAAP